MADSNPLPKRQSRADGGGSLYLRGTVWWLKLYGPGGQPTRQSTNTADFEEAKKFRDRILGRRARGEMPSSGAGEVTLGALLDMYLEHLESRQRPGEYKTSTAYIVKTQINAHVRPALGSLKSSKLATAMMTHYREARGREGAKGTTVNRELSYLRAAMKLGQRTTPPLVCNLPYFPILRDLERKNARTGTISQSQYEALLLELPIDIRHLLPLAVFTAVRRKEALFIKWSNVDFQNRQITLVENETKNGHSRLLPMPQPVVDALLEAKAFRDQYWPSCDWVFQRDGEQMKSFVSSWDRACVRAGLYSQKVDSAGQPVTNAKGKPLYDKAIHLHDARRTAVSFMHELEVSISDMKKVSGHLTDEMLSRYNRDRTAVSRVREKMDHYLTAAARGPSTGVDDNLQALAALPKYQLEALIALAGSLKKK